MRSLMTLVAAALALNLAAASAQASCIQQTLAEQAERADIVAFGRVSGTSFEIRQVLKGQAGGNVQVRFGETPGAVTSVDYMATNGDHTLYLRRDGSGYATNACSGSHQGAPTAEERAFFNVGEAASGGTASSGETYTAGPVASLAPVALLVGLLAALIVAFVIMRGRRKASA